MPNFKLLLPLFLLLLASCFDRQPRDDSHPWGSDPADDVAMRGSEVVGLDEIISNGEIIVATMSGPDTYYDYRGIALGTQYMLMQRFAEEHGVVVRVEVCEDTTAVLDKVATGQADVAMLFFSGQRQGFALAGATADNGQGQWMVNSQNESLSKALSQWYTPELQAQVQKQEAQMLSGQVVTHHSYAYFLDRQNGVISQYDALFKDCSSAAGCDWRLLASMCYQESRFDCEAKSFAGACGLMQLMPSTAEHLGLPREEIFNPEKNVATAARYIAQLQTTFKDIGSDEQMKFVLAAYNGGAGHIRDAMTLARNAGHNAQQWNEVAPFVLALSDPSVYRQPGIKYGYMRGTETVDYVASVYKRWFDYRGIVGGPDIFDARELSLEDILADFHADAPSPAPSPSTQQPPGDYSAVDRSADHAHPTPATTKRREKYDVN